MRRAVAWIVVWALVASQALPALSARHLFADPDAECGPALANDHVTSQFEAVRSPLADEHCAVCHWARAVNGARPGVVVAALVAVDLREIVSVTRPIYYALDLGADAASRAPPTLS